MFGLPAAALAMYRNADEDKKKFIGSIMLAGAVASFLTGITEPLEFSFMFVAPSLFLIHATLTGITVFIAASFKWIAGFSFSAGLIDYVLSIRSPFANNPFMLLLLGLGCGFVYYVIFDFCIRKFNLSTPGRERDEGSMPLGIIQQLLQRKEYDEIAILICEAIGGRNNISHIDTCITRLHIEVKQSGLVDKNKLSACGILKVFKAGNTVQIMIGTDVQYIMEAMNEILE
jgi:PTS system N-acetylglucosamine-specific IIC component